MRTVLRSLPVLWLCVVIVAAPRASAQVAFPSVEERVLGVRGDGAGMHGGPDGGRARIEFGDMELFGIAGLRISGARLFTAVRGVPVGAELARLGSPVGAQQRACGSIGWRGDRWRASLRAGVESLALRGAATESSPVIGLASAADVGSLSLSADVETIAGGGDRAWLLALAMTGRIGARASVVTSLRYDGPGALALGVAAIAPLHSRLSLLAGYDDGTETLRVAAVIATGRWRVASGVFRHPVLGQSQGLSLAGDW
ncbi:MAG TPA: hypothetical protein VFX92_00980 [Candidatus Krumholzibacteria bacterium]|nr:hypothetical protein [Candidatus Krumholzibacteria bacterium]